MSQSRQLKGTPVGGQFAASTAPGPDHSVTLLGDEEAVRNAVTDELFAVNQQMAALRARQDILVGASFALNVREAVPDAHVVEWEVSLVQGEDGEPVPLVSLEAVHDAGGVDITPPRDDERYDWAGDLLAEHAHETGILRRGRDGEKGSIDLSRAVEAYRATTAGEQPQT